MCVWNGKVSVWCGWESMAGLGVAGAQLEEVCRDGVVCSLWNQARSRAGHGCSTAQWGKKSSEPVAQEEGKERVGGCSFIQIQLTELLYIP